MIRLCRCGCCLYGFTGAVVAKDFHRFGVGVEYGRVDTDQVDTLQFIT
jgi:hypothetical protein